MSLKPSILKGTNKYREMSIWGPTSESEDDTQSLQPLCGVEYHEKLLK